MSKSKLNIKLLNAAYSGNFQQVSSLLESGADIDYQRCTGHTALHSAAFALKTALKYGKVEGVPVGAERIPGYVNIICLLIEKGSQLGTFVSSKASGGKYYDIYTLIGLLLEPNNYKPAIKLDSVLHNRIMDKLLTTRYKKFVENIITRRDEVATREAVAPQVAGAMQQGLGNDGNAPLLMYPVPGNMYLCHTQSAPAQIAAEAVTIRRNEFAMREAVAPQVAGAMQQGLGNDGNTPLLMYPVPGNMYLCHGQLVLVHNPFIIPQAFPYPVIQYIPAPAVAQPVNNNAESAVTAHIAAPSSVPSVVKSENASEGTAKDAADERLAYWQRLVNNNTARSFSAGYAHVPYKLMQK